VRRHLTAALDAAPTSVSSPAIPAALADTLADHGWLGPAVWADALRVTSGTVAARFAALAPRGRKGEQAHPAMSAL